MLHVHDATWRIEAGKDRRPALEELLSLEAGIDDLLAGDPNLSVLSRLALLPTQVLFGYIGFNPGREW